MPPPNAMRQKWRILTLRGSANEFICHFCAQANSARTFRGRTECFGRHPSNRCHHAQNLVECQAHLVMQVQPERLAKLSLLHAINQLLDSVEMLREELPRLEDLLHVRRCPQRKGDVTRPPRVRLEDLRQVSALAVRCDALRLLRERRPLSLGPRLRRPMHSGVIEFRQTLVAALKLPLPQTELVLPSVLRGIHYLQGFVLPHARFSNSQLSSGIGTL